MSPDGPAPAPSSEWARINRGSIVLATEGPMEGWFEAVVTEAKGDDLFLLKWRDWPNNAPFLRKRHQLAILPPGAFAR